MEEPRAAHWRFRVDCRAEAGWKMKSNINQADLGKVGSRISGPVVVAKSFVPGLDLPHETPASYLPLAAAGGAA